MQLLCKVKKRTTIVSASEKPEVYFQTIYNSDGYFKHLKKLRYQCERGTSMYSPRCLRDGPHDGKTQFTVALSLSSMVITEIVRGFPLMRNGIEEEVKRSERKRLFCCFLALMVRGVAH